jgi:hypothetical protein
MPLNLQGSKKQFDFFRFEAPSLAGSNPTTAKYNPSVVKLYNAKGSLTHLKNKNFLQL